MQFSYAAMIDQIGTACDHITTLWAWQSDEVPLINYIVMKLIQALPEKNVLMEKLEIVFSNHVGHA